MTCLQLADLIYEYIRVERRPRGLRPRRRDNLVDGQEHRRAVALTDAHPSGMRPDANPLRPVLDGKSSETPPPAGEPGEIPGQG